MAKQGTLTTVGKKADRAVDEAAQKYEHTKEVMAQKVDDVRAYVGDTAAHVKEKALEAQEATREYVRENPEKSIGIAAGVGALIGALIALLITRR